MRALPASRECFPPYDAPSPQEPYMTTDTIAAIATAPGAGGIGIVRVSGPGALPILEKLFAPAGKGGYKPWILRRGRVQDTEGNTLDDSLAVFMPGPKTFTAAE